MDKIISAEAKMKKILILSYHFPPMNVIASQRALGYANHFKKYGFEPTILTFDWSKSYGDQKCEKSEFDKLIIHKNFENYSVIQIPVIRSAFLDWMGKQEGKTVYKLWILFCWLTGRLDVRPKILSYGRSEKYFLLNNLNVKDYDCVLGIFSPHFHLKHLYLLNRKSKLPFVLDHRDLWDNRVIHKKYSPSLLQKIADRSVIHYWKKWGRNSLFKSITSIPWAQKLNDSVGGDIHVITNGFESSEFKRHEEVFSTSTFKILHTGSLYRHQNFTIFIDGLKMFLDDFQPDDFEIKFLGGLRGSYGDRSLNGVLGANDLAFLQDFKSVVTITERVSREEVIKEMNGANFLLIPTFPDAPGTFGGKIFEYLGSGKSIIAIPADGGVIDELLKETNSGVSIDSAERFRDYLEQEYIQWKKNKRVEKIDVIHDQKVIEYSRMNQTMKLATLINEKLSDGNN